VAQERPADLVLHNGDKIADFSIELTGAFNLSAADFIL
jgi:hypothetical protein